MKIGKYEYFIPQNVALYGATKIGVYNSNEKRLGGFLLQNLRLPRLGNKLYSFGALSDIHITNNTASEDFQKALTYLNNDIDVAFTCICGDMTDLSYENEFIQYKAIVDEYSADTPVYAIAGNHDRYANQSLAYFSNYTGYPLFYSLGMDVNGQCVASDITQTPIAYGDNVNDVFIMVGHWKWVNSTSDELFSLEELQWLYETLELNRNKRCIVFSHVFPWGDSGNANNLYEADFFSGTKGNVFNSLMEHYKNVIVFHGHSHIKFDLQEVDAKANYSENLGYRSIHIPSLSVPRDLIGTSLSKVYADSEGYVIDVYKKYIVLRGRDFAKDKFLPIATYCLNTTLVEIEAGTYVDSTGTITT